MSIEQQGFLNAKEGLEDHSFKEPVSISPDYALDRETQIIQKTFKNEKGEIVCIMTAEIDTKEQKIEQLQRSGRVLRKLELKHPETGKVIDVLDLVGLPDIQIFTSKTHSMDYGYDQFGKFAYVPPLETVIDLAVLLHELGHGSQFHDPKFLIVTKDAKVFGGLNRDPQMLPEMSRIMMAREAFPFLKEQITEEGLAQFRSVQDLANQSGEISMKLGTSLNKKQYVQKERLKIEGRTATTIRSELRHRCARLFRKMWALKESLESSQTLEDIAEGNKKKAVLLQAFAETLGDSGLTWEEVEALERFVSSSGAPDTSFVFPTIEDHQISVSLSTIIGRTVIFTIDEEFAIQDIKSDLQETHKWKALEDGYRVEAEKYSVASKEALAIWRAQYEGLKAQFPSIFQVENVYIQFMERDATRRAFIWMKQIFEQIGVDLLQSMLIERKALPGHTSCERSVEDGIQSDESGDDLIVSDVKTNLGMALWSYMATTKMMENTYGDSLNVKGFTPEVVELP